MNSPVVEKCREFNLMLTHVHSLSKCWRDIKLLEIKQLQGALLGFFFCRGKKKLTPKNVNRIERTFVKKNRLRHVKSINSRLIDAYCVLTRLKVSQGPTSVISMMYQTQWGTKCQKEHLLPLTREVTGDFWNHQKN